VVIGARERKPKQSWRRTCDFIQNPNAPPTPPEVSQTRPSALRTPNNPADAGPSRLELRALRSAKVKDAASATERSYASVRERVARARTPRLALLSGALLAAWALASLPSAQAEPLPDNRGYELVSPPQKNGGEIMPDSQRTRAAADGSAVGFTSLAGFADFRAMGVSADYISVRNGTPGTNGWATHILIPHQTAMPYVADTHFMEPAYWGEFSPDLTKGIFRSFSPVTNDPDVANMQNLYLRDDLRSPGQGDYSLLTACPGCSQPLPPVSEPLKLGEQSFLAGASADFGHVLFESDLPLTAESTADPETNTWNLFESDHGTVRLVGILPDSACGSPPCVAPESQAGQGARNAVYTPGTVSSDGSRVFFTVPASAAQCGQGVADCGDLYLREDHAGTVKLNATEKTNANGPGGTDPNGPLPAQYWDASADGSRAFFISFEALTDDAPVNGDRKLYMYSVAPDAQGHHLALVSADEEHADDATASDDVVGVIGVSDDGRTIYFVDGGGQLVLGAQGSISGIANKVFVWHDGALKYIGGTVAGDQLQNLNESYVAAPKQARVSPDGHAMVFSAAKGTGLTGYNHGSCPNNGTANGTCRELYLYRTEETPHLLCVSCNPSGAKATADASDVVHTGTGGATVTYHLNHAVSDDDRRVFFSSGEALVPEDTNGVSDAYEYDVPSETVHLLSSGTDPNPSYFMDASASGDDAFILTRERLTGWDADGGYDLYDARVNGGLPEPQAPVICQGETCHEAATPPPPPPSIASAGFSGPANPKAPKCKRGRVQKHGKCVKAGKRHKPHKRAGAKHGGTK
jgi:hypothetical protein